MNFILSRYIYIVKRLKEFWMGTNMYQYYYNIFLMKYTMRLSTEGSESFSRFWGFGVLGLFTLQIQIRFNK